MQSVNDQPRSNVCGWSTVLFLCAFLTGCGGGGQPAGNEPAGNEPQENSAVVTRSFDGTVDVTSGQTRTVSVTFNSSNADSLANLLVTTDLAALPAGWSAPGTFECPVVGTDNGCVLHLTYSPAATGSGSLTIAFTYQTATGRMSAGSERISYAATSDSNVVATTSPSGQITAIVGTGSQLVAVTFNADSGAASNLRLQSPLASLPAGWSSPLTEFSCQSVGTGNGCLLPLSFSPAAKATGTLTLEYTYTSDAGVAKSGSAAISYLGTTHNNIVALASPAGQITGVVGSSQEITVTFNSDDGNAINGLSLTTDLTQLPVGWSSTAAGLSCADVASGNGCRLPLTFAPNAQAAGTLHLTFAYHDDSGAAKTGSLSIDYVATAHNNVAANVVPSGQIAAVAGSGSRSVSVQFATDDGQPAKGLQLTSDLSSLPAGWSSVATEFKCTLVNAGTPCWLPLTFAPSAAGMGSLPLTYTYIDNAGSSKTGSVSIPFAGTTRNNVIAQVDLSSVQIQLGETRDVTVTFVTDDSRVATNLAITSGLSSLPAGWSGAETSLACSSVSVGTGCRVHLTYTPTVAASGSVTLNYSYTDNSGTAKTGSASITYSATAPVLYVTNFDASSNYVALCTARADGSLATCLQSQPDPTDSSQELSNISDVDYRGGTLAIAQPARVSNGVPSVLVPSLNNDGTIKFVYGLSNVVAYPTRLTITPDATQAYVHGSASGLSLCDLGSASCSQIATPHDYEKVVFAANGNYVYGAYPAAGGGWSLERCTVQFNGTFANCIDVGGHTSSLVLEIAGNRLYAKDMSGGLDVCPIQNDYTLGTCIQTVPAESPYDVAFTATNAYLTTYDAYMRRCAIHSDGTLGSCVTLNDPAFTVTTGVAVR